MPSKAAVGHGWRCPPRWFDGERAVDDQLRAAAIDAGRCTLYRDGASCLFPKFVLRHSGEIRLLSDSREHTHFFLYVCCFQKELKGGKSKHLITPRKAKG